MFSFQAGVIFSLSNTFPHHFCYYFHFTRERRRERNEKKKAEKSRSTNNSAKAVIPPKPRKSLKGLTKEQVNEHKAAQQAGYAAKRSRQKQAAVSERGATTTKLRRDIVKAAGFRDVSS